MTIPSRHRPGAALVVSLSSFLLFPGSLFPQGTLAPPGAPAPTLKTLTQVEPRTDINAMTTGTATSVVTISTPGAYYLTGNMVGVAGKDTIVVTTAGVSIDLNGFSVLSTDVNRTAILATGAPSLTVRNGRLVGGTYGLRATSRLSCSGLVVEGGSTMGIQASSDSIVERCQVSLAGISVALRSFVSDCATTGVAGISAGAGSQITRCSLISGGITLGVDAQANHCNVNNPPGVGIEADDRCVVRYCNVFNSQFSGIVVGARSLVEHCAVTSTTGVAANNDAGFVGEIECIFESCRANLCDVQGFFASSSTQFKNCLSTTNGGNGFTSGAQSRFSDCTASGNSGLGFSVANRSVLSGCIASGNNAGGIYVTGLGAIVERCTAIANSGGAGIRVDTGSIRDCEVRENLGAHGIRCSSGSYILRNTSNFNGVAALPQNGFLIEGGRGRVEGNHAYNNSGLGLEVTNTSSTNSVLVIGNSVGSNDLGEFSIGAGNAVGPFLAPSSVPTNTVPNANFNL